MCETNNVDLPLSCLVVGMVWVTPDRRHVVRSATVNALVRGSRKSAANCDTHCDVQYSENNEDFERVSYIEYNSLCTRVVVVKEGLDALRRSSHNVTWGSSQQGAPRISVIGRGEDMPKPLQTERPRGKLVTVDRGRA